MQNCAKPFFDRIMGNWAITILATHCKCAITVETTTVAKYTYFVPCNVEPRGYCARPFLLELTKLMVPTKRNHDLVISSSPITGRMTSLVKLVRVMLMMFCEDIGGGLNYHEQIVEYETQYPCIFTKGMGRNLSHVKLV